MKQPPYDTGKVKIGVHYEPPRHIHMSRDAELLQESLLDKPVSDLSFEDIKPIVIEAALWVASAGLLLAILYSPSLFKLFGALK